MEPGKSTRIGEIIYAAPARNSGLQPGYTEREAVMDVDFEKIKSLVAKRDAFLREHPELQPLQEEVNAELYKAGNDIQRRNAVIQNMMLNSWYRVVDTWKKLQSEE